MEFVERQQRQEQPEATASFATFIRDWTIKVKSCQTTEGGGVACHVSARTLDRATKNPTDKRFVFYVPTLFGKDRSKIKSFEGLSSPTRAANMMAGEYQMWSQLDQTVPAQAPDDASVKDIQNSTISPVEVLDPK